MLRRILPVALLAVAPCFSASISSAVSTQIRCYHWSPTGGIDQYFNATDSAGLMSYCPDTVPVTDPVVIPGEDVVYEAEFLYGSSAQASAEADYWYVSAGAASLAANGGPFGAQGTAQASFEDALTFAGQSGTVRFTWHVSGARFDVETINVAVNILTAGNLIAPVIGGRYDTPLDETYVVNLPFADGDRIEFSALVTAFSSTTAEASAGGAIVGLDIEVFDLDGNPMRASDASVLADSGMEVYLDPIPEPGTYVPAVIGLGWMAWQSSRSRRAYGSERRRVAQAGREI